MCQRLYCGPHGTLCSHSAICEYGLVCHTSAVVSGDTNVCVTKEESSDFTQQVKALANRKLVWVDKDTGLMWSKEVTFGDCNNTLADYSDWRTPSIDQLVTLVRGCPATLACKSPAGCTPRSADGSNDGMEGVCPQALCGGCEEDRGPMDGAYMKDDDDGYGKLVPFVGTLKAECSSDASGYGEDMHYYGIRFVTGAIDPRGCSSNSNGYAYYGYRCVRTPSVAQ